jgi:hypothetical protein
MTYPQGVNSQKVDILALVEISHVAGKDNVVADALSRYPELAGQSYDHLLPEEQEMDLLCAHLFNINTICAV